eukprot:UN3170
MMATWSALAALPLASPSQLMRKATSSRYKFFDITQAAVMGGFAVIAVVAKIQQAAFINEVLVTKWTCNQWIAFAFLMNNLAGLANYNQIEVSAILRSVSPDEHVVKLNERFMAREKPVVMEARGCIFSLVFWSTLDATTMIKMMKGAGGVCSRDGPRVSCGAGLPG